MIRPQHYQSKGKKDVIDFCKDYDLNFNRGNIVKYIARAGRKGNEMEDLTKAYDYLTRELFYIKSQTK